MLFSELSRLVFINFSELRRHIGSNLSKIEADEDDKEIEAAKAFRKRALSGTGKPS